MAKGQSICNASILKKGSKPVLNRVGNPVFEKVTKEKCETSRMKNLGCYWVAGNDKKDGHCRAKSTGRPSK